MNIEERFLQYVSIDTTSNPHSTTTPSTSIQKNLGKVLVEQLLQLGVSDAHMDEFGIVYGSIKENCEGKQSIGFLAHMDTSCDAPGNNIKPQKITNYQGGKILLNKEKDLYLDPEEFSSLQEVIGHDLITTDGTTLLGSDDKAGIAIIMEMIAYVHNHPEYLHGPIKIAFTPDEEVGRGVDHFDVEKFGATIAYTLDGGFVHEIGYENFNAFGANVEIIGKSIHPGDAKNKMIPAIRVAMEFESMLPPMAKAEYTEGYEGFIHLLSLNGTCEHASMEYILRNHDLAQLKQQLASMEDVVDYLNKKYGYEVCKFNYEEQYLNMYEVLKDDMQVVEQVITIMNELGITPRPAPIRGGTDGARLTFMNLPCPNLGTGGCNFHGRYEYVSLTMMKQAVQIVLRLIQC